MEALSRRSIKFASSSSSPAKPSMSSAKRRLVIGLPLMLTVPSCSSKASVVILSRNMLKRVHKSRHPYQTPVVVWTQSLVITLPKKGNLQQCQNYRTTSLISHPSKVMLKVILNRLKPQAEKAGFRAGRSTTEQIFNLRILCEKYLQH